MNTSKLFSNLLLALVTVILVSGCRHPAAEGAMQPGARAGAVVRRAQTPAPTPTPKAKIEVMSAQELAQAFADDRTASTVRFAHRTVEVTGEVGNLEAGGDGTPVVTLKGGKGSTNPRFVLDADAWPDVSTLKTGATVRLSCRDGSESAGQVTLKACALL
ncbi:hypothetical protein [Xanthomonas sp. NCPPB 2632]|jgi:hypothetical protein|uniref:OB-fold protein n=1 Tax=Xanthomonas sp. NCPPB 2632 TaxID=3240912 RepID=UPI003513211A